MSFTLIQSATGSVGASNASSVTVATSATQSAHLLVAFVVVQGQSVTITPPSGWSQVGSTQGVSNGTGSVAMYYLPNSPSGLTSFTFSFSASCNAAVALEEWAGVALTNPLDQYIVQKNSKSSTALTGTIPTLSGSGELAIWGLSVFPVNILTFSSITNGYTEDITAYSSESTRAQTALFYNTNVGSSATSSGCTMSGTGAAGNTTILAVFKPSGVAASPLATTSTKLLPGQRYVNGVSNLLFGSNTPPMYGSPATEVGFVVSSTVQSLVKQAGVTVMRIAVSNGTTAYTDAQINARITACQNAGCIPLVIIPHDVDGEGSSWTFAKHVVTLLGNSCSLYEVFNEPDLNSSIPQTPHFYSGYLNDWNTLVPLLRAINPNAAFGGPVLGVVANFNSFLQPWLAGCVTSGVLPDFVSFHDYPCGTQPTWSVCLTKAPNIGNDAASLNTIINNTLGYSLPIAITEWNMDYNNPPASYANTANSANNSNYNSWMSSAFQGMVNNNVAMACMWDCSGNAESGEADMIQSSSPYTTQASYAPFKSAVQQYLGLGQGGSGGTVTNPYGITIGSSASSGTLNAAAITDMKALGITWLRYQIAWHLIDATGTTNQNASTYTWNAWDSAVSQCNAAGINIILSIFQAPSQFQTGSNPLAPSYTATFAQQIAQRYNGGSHGTIQAIEIGNEDFDQGSGASSAGLVATLKAVYPVVKAVNSSFMVGAGAKLQRNSANYTSWFDTLLNTSTGAYSSGVFQADYLNFHYYTGIPTSGSNPVSLDPTVSIPSYNGGQGLPSITDNGDNNCAWKLIDAKRQQYGNTTPVWCTETGFAINTNPGRLSSIVVSQSTQWTYLKDVIDACRMSGVVTRVFPFTLGYYDGYGTGTSARDGMSLVQGKLNSPIYTTAYTGMQGYTASYPTWGTPGGNNTPVLATTPLSLLFNAPAGGSNPAAQTLQVTETNGAGTTWTSNITYNSGSGWLSLSPTSGAVAAYGSQSVTVSATTGSLTPGTYTATITFTAGTGGATATTSVTFTVTGGGSSGTTPLTLYITTALDSLLPNAAQAVTATGASGSTTNHTAIGTASNWGSLAFGSNPSWAGSTSPGPANGYGAIFDSTALEGQTFGAGTWTLKTIVSCSAASTSETGPLELMVYKYTSGNYTLLGTGTLASATYGTTATAVSVSASLPAVSFLTGDKLYWELWFQSNSHTGTPVNLLVTTSNSATLGYSGAGELDTPGYQPTSSGSSIITRVQGKASTSGYVSSFAAALSSGVTTGNLLVAAVAVGTNQTTLTGPAGWQKAAVNVPAGSGGSSSIQTSLWYAIVGQNGISAGQSSWTWSTSGNHYFFACIEEWNSSTGWQANPLDVSASGDTASNPAQATTISSGTTSTTAQGSELWVASLAYKYSAQAESSITAGWTKDLEASVASNNTMTLLYQVASSTGAASCSYVIGTAEYWAGCIATFKPAVSQPALTASPSTLSYTAIAGGTPASQNVTLSETAGFATGWTSNLSYGSGGSGWLTVTPASGSLAALGSTQLVVSCSTVGLASGVYTATLTLTASVGGATTTVTVTLVVLTSSSQPYPRVILAEPSLQAYYRLDESGGLIAYDSSGYGHNAVLSGVTGYGQGGALSSDSDTAMSFTAGGGLTPPFGLGISSWSAISLEFWITVGGQWQYVVVTCNDSSTLLYINSVPVASQPGSALFVDGLFDLAGMAQAASLDEVAIYNSVLSPAQIATHYVAAFSTPLIPPLTITIGGQTVPFNEDDFSITYALGERWQASFTVPDTTGTLFFSYGEKVVITDANLGVLFVGYISDDTYDKQHTYPDTTVEHKITCMDNRHLADKRTSNLTYTTPTVAGKIVVDMVNQVLGSEGVQASYAAQTTTTQNDWAGGTLTNVVATYNVDDGDLELAPASGSITTSVTTQSGWSANGTLSHVVANSGGDLALPGVSRNWDNGSVSGQSLWGNGSPTQGVNSSGNYTLTCTAQNECRTRLDFAGTWGDCTIAIDMALGGTIPYNSLVYRTAGSAWNNADSTWAYAIEINLGVIRLQKGSNGGSGGTPPTTLASYSFSPQLAPGWYTLTVTTSTSGSSVTHTISLNGTQYINVTDTSGYTAAGYIGIRNRNTENYTLSQTYDNFGVMSSLTGTWTSHSISLAGISTIATSVIEWDNSLSTGGTVTVQASINGGTGYTTCQDGAVIPGLTKGVSGSGKTLVIQVTLSTNSPTLIPDIRNLSWSVQAGYVSSGTRVSGPFSLGSVGQCGSTFIGWNANVPVGTSLDVQASPDGSTWYDVTAQNGGSLPWINGTPIPTTDGFDSNSISSYTSTFQSGGTAAAWTVDTVNSRLIGTGGTNAILYSTLLQAQNVDVLAILDQADSGGLVLDLVDTSDFYLVSIADNQSVVSTPNTITLFKVAGGVATQLMDASISCVRGTHHTLRATVSAGVLTIRFDGTTLLTYTDSSPLGAGFVGFYTNGGAVGSRYSYLWIQPQGDILTNQNVYTKQMLSTTDTTVTPQVLDLTVAAFGPQIDPGTLIPSANYAYTFCDRNMDDLARQSNYEWWIDQFYTLYFNAREGLPAPWVLQSNTLSLPTDLEVDNQLQVEVAGDQYRNRQILTNVINTGTFTDTFVGNGSQSSFTLRYPIATGTIPSVTLDTVGQKVGVKGTTGSQWYYAEGDATIAEDSSGPTLTLTDTLSVTYTGQFTTTVIIDNTAAQAALAQVDETSGIVESVVDVSSQNMTYAAAQVYGQALLNRFCVVNASNTPTGRTLTFQTFRNGLQVGQLLPVYVPELNLQDVLLLIHQITLKMRTQPNNTVLYSYLVVASELAKVKSYASLLAEGLTNIG